MGNKSTPKMNYDNYERAIVETYHVELKHFPGGIVKQPGKLRRHDLQALIAALEDPNPYSACQWAPLSEAAVQRRIACNKEREKNGEQVYVPRKKNTGGSKAKSRPEVSSSEESSEESSEDE